jgi:YVTN family beta-propeller protein
MNLTGLKWCLGIALIVLASFTSIQAQNNSSSGLLLVANQGDHSLSILDPNAGKMVGKVVSNEIRGHEVVASPDGKLAYLPIYGDSGVGVPGTDGRNIEIIDIAKKTIIAKIDLGRPVRPHCVKVGTDGLLYVTAELDKSLYVVDPKTQKVIATVPTGQPESHMFVFSKDGKRAYTSNVGVGTVSVLDVSGRKTVAVIPVAEVAQRISISTDDRYVFTADQRRARLLVIETSQNKVTKWIDLPAVGYGTAATPDGKSLLVTMPDAGKVAVVDLMEMKVVHTLDVPAHPVEILIRADQPVAYVSCSGDGKVAVIDTKQWRVNKTIDSGPGADGLAWAKN